MIGVRLENVVKRFGATVALDGVSLDIAPGELFFLLGPSGSGKTTLLRCVAGFHIPEEGRVLFDGQDVTRLETHLRHTGMVFQSYALWPHLNVVDNIGFGLKQQQLTRDEISRRVHEAMSSAKIAGLGERRINQLSGGEQQRVALARALVTRPRCLLLDEPLSNLDARLRQEMRGEIRRICKESGLTTIYVTHDQKDALSIGDRVAVLAAGKIRQIGIPRELYKRPCNRFVADFIGETNFLPGEIVHAGAGEALVRTAVGDFQGILADPSVSLSPGAKVTLSIRPECLKIEEQLGEENSLSGRIGEVTYYGDVAHYEFEVAARNGHPDAQPPRLRICELNPRHWPGDSSKTCFAYAAADDVVVLAE